MTAQKTPEPLASSKSPSTVSAREDRNHSPAGDTPEAQVQVDLESRIAGLQKRLEPLARAIGAEVEVRPLVEEIAAPREA